MADTYKFRIDHHGGLVRPPEVLAAREKHAAGGLGAAELREVERLAVVDAVALQRKLRLSVVTDGEYRRADFRSAVLDAVSGFRRTGGTVDGMDRWIADGDPKAVRPLVADDAVELAGLTVIAAKATLPAPSYLAAQCFEAGTGPASARELGEALAAIVREEIEQLVARGIRYVQLTNPDYARDLDAAADAGRTALSFEDALAVDALAVGLASKPDDVRIGLCPVWTAPAEVDRAAAERLYAAVPVDRWILPYTTGSAGETALLAGVPVERDVCLGIVDATLPGLEDIDAIMARMDVVADLKDIEDVAVSPDRSFSSVAGVAALTADQQRRKLIHVETVARMCWGNEL
ncbi:methionine synthase II (cobalamin-independent)-like protein [Kitasatospora sp. NBC_01539]|uniref:methionine synthase II (cobalamin-independent)-like protein n=1 Tax=Kitasatospora sp. NBC_01539 TaxID=2903577 RepID=UPI00386030ED